jgi:transposase
LSERIREYDRRLEEVADELYPETKLLRQIHGVGALTALAFVLTLEDPSRFAKSRQEVGPYLGLVPTTDQSGKSDPQRRISKHGNELTRKLLVNCAHYVLGPFGEDSDLRRHGEKIAERGGKNAKKRAVVAVARGALGGAAPLMGHGRGLRTTVQREPPRAPGSLRALRGTEG